MHIIIMGVTQYENLIGAIISVSCSLSSSRATLSHRVNGACCALRKRELTMEIGMGASVSLVSEEKSTAHS